MTLKSLLGLADHQLHSIVYFIGDCTFKTPMPENVMRRGLVSYIKSKTTPVLSTADVHRIVDTIQQGRLTASWQTHRQHVPAQGTPYRPIRQPCFHPLTCQAIRCKPTLTKRIATGQSPICPRCGSTMVLRTATRGEQGQPVLGMQ